MQEPNSRPRGAILRTAITLAVIAVLVYVGFIVLQTL